MAGKYHTADYLRKIGIPPIPPCLSPFDPGYDPQTLEGHLEQSSRLIAILKLSMACWLVASEGATRRKIAAAKKHNVPTVTGGGPFEIAVAQGELPAYLDLRGHRRDADRVRGRIHGHAPAGRGRGQDGGRARPGGSIRAGQETHGLVYR